MGAHEHGREAHVRPPGVHHLLHREALQAYEGQVHEPLHEREVPPIAAAQHSTEYYFFSFPETSETRAIICFAGGTEKERKKEKTQRRHCSQRSTPELKPVVDVFLEQEKSRKKNQVPKDGRIIRSRSLFCVKEF